VEAFVRPHGLERDATPILADEVEKLASLPVERQLRPGALVLRLPLAVEAALTSLSIALPDLHLRKGLRRWRRRIGAKARRLGLLPGS
jgi:hypothetical protein